MFNPFFNPYRVRRIDQGGIPTLDTIFSNVDTTNNTVTYGICPFQWRQLPCRGLILLNINHTATGATEGSLVSVATSVSSSQVSSNPTSVNTNSGKALLNGSGDQMPTEEISTGNRYLIYYDKRTGVFQTINHIVAPAATQVSNPYDEALPQGQFPIPGQNRRKLVDVFISCNGESKKLSVPAERSIINDTSIGLTVATNKEEIANMVRQNYNEFKAKKEAASKYDEEMEKCKDILDQLEAQVEDPIVTNTIDNSKEINDLKNDVADIRKMIEDTKKMFMGGFPKPPMPPMPNVPAPMK